MHFTPGSVGSAMEAVRNYKPRTIAIDAVFGQTPMGVAFIDRVDALGIAGSTIKLIVEHDGRWITAARHGAPAPMVVLPDPPEPAPLPTPAQVTVPPPPITAAVAAAAREPGPSGAVSSTRRVPRFAMQGSVDALVESGRASVIDMSMLGAQLVSIPALRPNQRIMVGLPDDHVTLNVIALVAWSSFERPTREVEPYYRAGIEFTGPSRDALEDYRLRHCSTEPLPLRWH